MEKTARHVLSCRLPCFPPCTNPFSLRNAPFFLKSQRDMYCLSCCLQCLTVWTTPFSPQKRTFFPLIILDAALGGEMAPPKGCRSFHFLFRPPEPKSVSCTTRAEAGFLRTCSLGLSSCVRPKRSERRSAVDRAFGRARQARSTWPWSERAKVGPSVAQKDGSRARGPPLRAGQHRIPPARPIGGIALISMKECWRRAQARRR